MVFDALDGYVGRLSRSASAFGKELDSLCDAISFGVAPAFLLLCIGQDWGANQRARQVIAVISALYVVCTILRLARFNVESPPEPGGSNAFKGLPSPAAAGCVAALAMLHSGFGVESNGLSEKMVADWVATWAPLGTLLVALLMVSNIPYPHFTKQLLRCRRGHFGIVVQAVLVVFIIALTRGMALALFFWAYALAFPLRSLFIKRRRSLGPDSNSELEWIDKRKTGD